MKLRWSHGRLIFTMEIPRPGETIFILRRSPSPQSSCSCILYWRYCICHVSACELWYLWHWLQINMDDKHNNTIQAELVEIFFTIVYSWNQQSMMMNICYDNIVVNNTKPVIKYWLLGIPYGVRDLSKHWHRFIVSQHQAITWTNVTSGFRDMGPL